MSRFRKALASTAIAGAIVAGTFLIPVPSAMSGGETRTISLYHVHTGESLTVTYMVNGRYVPSAMKKINYLLRDWRRNEVITIDPKTIDLVWELHADLGSHAPVHIVCGYRSARTNSFLKSIGRNVAKQSQHILGKAIDIYFPDVPTIKMRNSALVRQVGGVGYYRSAGGPTGFLHVDSGHVRHWGPGISSREMAQIFRDYRKTVGARLNGQDRIMVADSSSNSPSQQDKQLAAKAKNAPADDSDDSADDESGATNGAALASLSAEASKTPPKPRAKEQPADAAIADADSGQLATLSDQVADAAPVVPKPRPKPDSVLMAAAVAAAYDMKIEPASALPPVIIKQNAPLKNSAIVVASADDEQPPVSNLSGKGSLTDDIFGGKVAGTPAPKTIVTASASSGGDLFWWPQPAEKPVRKDTTAQGLAGILPGGNAEAADVSTMPKLAVATLSASGKGDLQVVDRTGKGSLPADATVPIFRRQTVGELEGN